MTTKLEKPLAASQTTHVADMPPLEVVTEGIPPMEHIEFAPAAREEPLPVVREGWGRMWAWALAGVMGLLLVAAGVFAFTQYSSTDLTVVPPVGAEAGEPAEPGSGLLDGSELPYIPDLSIPAIPSIADVSIAAIPEISPMRAMSIPSIQDISIPDMSIPAISIPAISIPDLSIEFPSTPSTPSTQSTEFPSISIPSIEFPSFSSISPISIPSIEFPSFPAIQPISVASIPPLAEISIPPLTDM